MEATTFAHIIPFLSPPRLDGMAGLGDDLETGATMQRTVPLWCILRRTLVHTSRQSAGFR